MSGAKTSSCSSTPTPAKSDTILLLIDNGMSNLNINTIAKILNKDYFAQASYVNVNGQVVKKALVANYLPVATSATYLKLTEHSWSDTCQYANVCFVQHDRDQLTKVSQILALFYRLMTGRSMILIPLNDFTEHEVYCHYYPFFLTVFTNKKQHVMADVDVLTAAQLPAYRATLVDELKSLRSLNDKSLISTQGIDRNTDSEHDELFGLGQYSKLFSYILNKASDWQQLLASGKFANAAEKRKLERLCTQIEEHFKNEHEFKYYDAQFATYTSLTDTLQVSIPSGTDATVYVYTETRAADYLFRNLRFKNVLVNEQFVLPFYEDEQTTRQTVRFLVMHMYNVSNNSAEVDLIVLYLFMRVSLLDASEQHSMVKTKYENMARLFLKRHGQNASDQKEFLEENRRAILALKTHFAELRHLGRRSSSSFSTTLSRSTSSSPSRRRRWRPAHSSRPTTWSTVTRSRRARTSPV